MVMFDMLKEQDMDHAIFLKDSLWFAYLFPLSHYFEHDLGYLKYDEIHNAYQNFEKQGMKTEDSISITFLGLPNLEKIDFKCGCSVPKNRPNYVDSQSPKKSL